LFFVLQLGYFKASRMFFVFGLRDVEEDAAYLGVGDRWNGKLP